VVFGLTGVKTYKTVKSGITGSLPRANANAWPLRYKAFVVFQSRAFSPHTRAESHIENPSELTETEKAIF